MLTDLGICLLPDPREACVICGSIFDSARVKTGVGEVMEDEDCGPGVSGPTRRRSQPLMRERKRLEEHCLADDAELAATIG